MGEQGAGGLPGVIGLRTLMLAAWREAVLAGARDVRAEHLLLALAASGTTAGQVLAEAGLGRATLDSVLAAERQHSLAAVGMPPIPPDRLRATVSAGSPSWGASAREALLAGRRQAHVSRRTAQVARRMEQQARRLDQAGRHATRAGHGRPGQMSEMDLLHAVLSAELGTVPRALALAGIDRGALLDAVDRAAGED